MKCCLAVFVVILCSVQVLSELEQCSTSSLLRKCLCGFTTYDRERRYVVNCTDTKFHTTTMLETLPNETQVLIFTGNFIEELPWNVFGEFSILSNLTVIDMSNNGIREIKGKSYHHVTNVQRLILNHNNLTISDDELGDHHHHPRVFSNFINLLELHLTDAFADNTDTALANDLHDIFVNSNLSLLNKLHLEQNEIRGFRDRDVFCDLPSLMDLYLGDNFITGLTFNINCLKKLRFLDLEHNSISIFTKSELMELDSMTFPHRSRKFMIDIDTNPLNCTAPEMRDLYSWMWTTNVTVRGKEDLWCLRGRGKGATSLKRYFGGSAHAASKVVTVLLVILAIVLILLVAALVYLSRDRISTKCKPIFDIVSRKVHYTTIESQDV